MLMTEMTNETRSEDKPACSCALQEERAIEERVARAVDNFMAGYGCCQSVVAAFADLYGLDDVMAKRIAAGFGGGVGRLRMMCGAVSGIVMLVGLLISLLSFYIQRTHLLR